MGESRRHTVAGRMRMHAHAWMAASFGLRPASRRNSFYSPQPEWNPTHTVVFLSTLCLSLLFMKTANIAVAPAGPYWQPFVIILIGSFSPQAEKNQVKHRIWTNVWKCPDPRLILVHFSPSLIHLLSLLFLCTSLLSSSCHFYPHFLTPSWLLWPLNVSRWQDTTPIVIHPALSDHCVSALVNTDPPTPPSSKLLYPLMTWKGRGGCQSIDLQFKAVCGVVRRKCLIKFVSFLDKAALISLLLIIPTRS